MIVGFRLFCLVIVSLCHEGLAIEPLVDPRMSLKILKQAGPDWNDPKGADDVFGGNDPLMGNEKLNGQLFRISKKKDQDIIISDIENEYHRFLQRYYTGCVKLLFYSSYFVQGNEQAQCKD